MQGLRPTLDTPRPNDSFSGGPGLEIRAGTANSPFGPCVIALAPRGVCLLAFRNDFAAACAELARRWPRAILRPGGPAAAEAAAAIFDPTPQDGALGPRLFVRGTAFQLAVWRALLRIPFGTTTTYGAIARAVRRPAAARAVGTAVGANPVAWLIPCHRVLPESGAPGGYRWGAARKQAMLAWEKARRRNP